METRKNARAQGAVPAIGRIGAFLIAGSLLATGCASTTVRLGDFAAAVPQHSATQPGHKLDTDWWQERHAGVLEQIRSGNPDIILIGDSITHGWDRHMDIWNEHFGGYSMVNMGFGGDRTQHVLWRLDHGEIDGISPRLGIIMIGTNNSNGKDNTAQEIGDGIAAICAKLRAELPETDLLLLSIFPRGPRLSDQREKNDEASALAKRVAKSDKKIHFLNINEAFLAHDGMLSEEIMPDFLHPNESGYAIWAGEIEKKVHNLMRQ